MTIALVNIKGEKKNQFTTEFLTSLEVGLRFALKILSELRITNFLFFVFSLILLQ